MRSAVKKPIRSRRKSLLEAVRSGEGFSLIEVMVAITFLAIGLLAVAQMVPVGVAGVIQARVRTNATQSAQQKLEELKAADYQDAILTAGAYTETAGDYDLAWTITNNQPVPGSKRVDLTSSWENFSGVKTVTLTTYITNNSN